MLFAFAVISQLTQAKSFDSLTLVENEVRTSATAASSTIDDQPRPD
jgi:hypothetical protein